MRLRTIDSYLCRGMDVVTAAAVGRSVVVVVVLVVDVVVVVEVGGV